LKEFFTCPLSNKFANEFAENLPGHTTDLLQDLAKERKISIVGGSKETEIQIFFQIPDFKILILCSGSIPEKTETDKCYNTCPLFNETGFVGKYQKVCLHWINM